MIVLKQVIHAVPTNSVEATWVDRTTTPPQIVPEVVAPVIPYTELRRAAYPPVGDQLDAIWKGGADAAAMLVTINVVKTRFPK